VNEFPLSRYIIQVKKNIKVTLNYEVMRLLT